MTPYDGYDGTPHDPDLLARGGFQEVVAREPSGQVAVVDDLGAPVAAEDRAARAPYPAAVEGATRAPHAPDQVGGYPRAVGPAVAVAIAPGPQEAIDPDAVRPLIVPRDTGTSLVETTYLSPIVSTTYKGLENLDPRLASREWRLNNLYTVVDEDGVLVRFKLRAAQVKLLRGMHYKNIILKARQLGFTTFICIFLLDYALFCANRSIGIIAHTKDDASMIFRKVKIAWENFPKAIKDWLKLDTKGDSKVEYEFTNDSLIRISTSLRSGTYQAVLITEFGKICARFPEKASEIITGTLPAVPANGLVFIESTAEGETGSYYDMVQEAMANEREIVPLTVKHYKFFFFPWYENPKNVVAGLAQVPETTELYLQKMEALARASFTPEQRAWYYLEELVQKGKMRQEHPTTPDEAFLVSGNKLFNGDAIDRQRLQFMRKPIEKLGDFLIYRRFIPGHTYGLGADVSQGVSKDSSTIVVIDFTIGEVVLTYRSREIDPVLFAYEIKKAGVLYGICIAAPEVNSVGLTTVTQLKAIYPHIYQQVREGALDEKVTTKLGWLTTSLTKPRMMYELSQAIEDEDLRVPDEGILLEAKAYNKEDTLYVVAVETTTRHFDLLTAAAIAWQMRAYATRGIPDQEAVAKVAARRDAARTRTISRFR